VKARVIGFSIAAAVLLTILWYFLLYSPQSDKLDQAKADQAAQEARQSELQARLGRLKRLQANASVLEAERVKFATAVPENDDLDRFILDVNSRASSAGVEFVSIAPAQPAAGGPPAAAGAPTPIALQMQVQGDYFAILRFLEALRDGPRLVTVENFSLSGGGAAGAGGGSMSASIGGRMYISPGLATPVPQS
jgi:Tfp pilus assembly protein PilO